MVLIIIFQLFTSPLLADIESNSFVGDLNVEALEGASTTWFKCKNDSDCIITHGACSYPIAINKKYSKDVKFHILSKYKKPCIDFTAPAWPYGVICRKEKCESNWIKPKGFVNKIK